MQILPEAEAVTDPDEDERWSRYPLGLIADPRSGDKGGNANVGIWVGTPDAWRWLRHAVTEERFKELVPESSESGSRPIRASPP